MSGTLSATIQVNKPASSGCYANWYPVNSTGVPIHVNYVAGQPFDVYLMTALQWGLWYISEGAVCPPPPQYYLAKTSISSSGSFDVTANPSGNPFVLVFLTQGPLVNPAVALSMGPTVGLQTTTTTGSYPATTITIPYPATLTQTLTTYSIEQVPFLQANASWLIPVLVLAVAAIVTFILVAYALHRRRSGTTEPKLTELKPVISVAQSAEKATERLFCINCGADLPPKSKFCDKCGSAQA
jgi:ribosomal protein L40E